MASFDKDGEHDLRLAQIPLAALHARFLERFEGHQLCATMRERAQDKTLKRVVPRLEKAIEAALADLQALVAVFGDDATAEVPADARKPAIMLEIYWRVHDHWPGNAEAVAQLKLIGHDATAPKWKDLEALLTELARVDQDGGDGDSFPESWYEDLLARFEGKLGKKKPKAAAAKAAPAIKTPPAGATIHPYSPKATLQVGQWVEHPKFGVGCVLEVGAHATLEFAGVKKVLAHTPASTSTPSAPSGKSRSNVDTVELARAAGIEIKKIPGYMPEE